MFDESFQTVAGAIGLSSPTGRVILNAPKAERNPPMNLHEFARRIPKVEVHVHLEGAIRPTTLLKLSERNGIQLPAQDKEGLHSRRNSPDCGRSCID